VLARPGAMSLLNLRWMRPPAREMGRPERISITFIHIDTMIHDHVRRHTRGLARCFTGHVFPQGGKTFSGEHELPAGTNTIPCE